jgi:hypothetical protein
MTNQPFDSTFAVTIVKKYTDWIYFLTIFLIFLDSAHTVDAVPSEESFLDPNAEEFIPTKEWQSVKPGSYCSV